MQRDVSQILKKIEDFLFSQNSESVLLKKGGVSELKFSYLLIARLYERSRSMESEFSALWLDGNNSFNPFDLSEIARSFDIDPETILENVFISRAFTSYQFSWLIFRRLNEALENLEPEIIVITGITSTFMDSEVPDFESRNLFNSVFSELQNLQAEKESVLISIEPSGKYSDDFVKSNLEDMADAVLEVTGGGESVDLNFYENGF